MEVYLNLSLNLSSFQSTFSDGDEFIEIESVISASVK